MSDLKTKLVIDGDASGAHAAATQTEGDLQRVGEASRVAGAGLEAAFSSTGVRSAAAIKAEILEVQQALGKLATSGRVSGQEFERAFASAHAKIQALEAELAGVGSKGAAAMNSMAKGADTAVSAMKPMAQAIAAAFATDRIARAAVDMDSLKLALTAITGSSDKASAEMAYLSQTAQRLGLEMVSAGRAYSSFLAATKGSALEGQEAREIFESIAGAMARLGKSSADTEGALLSLTQMVSKGTVQMEEIQQAAERIPGFFKMAADSMGLTEKQFRDLVESGGLLADDLLPRLKVALRNTYDTGGQVDSLIAEWNRFQNAITEATGKLTETSTGVTGVQVALGLLRETALVVGTGVVTVFESIGLAAKSAAVAAATLAGNGTWAQARAEIKAMADESAARIAALAKETVIAHTVTEQFGDTVAEAGNKALAAGEKTAGAASKIGQLSPAMSTISAAFTQVAKAFDEYTQKAERVIEIDKARAANAEERVAIAGTERQIAAQRVESAEAEAAALASLAQAKADQVATEKSLLAGMVESLAAKKNASDADRQAVIEKEKLVDALAHEANKAAAAADAASILAEKQQLAAAAAEDNSARVRELGQAYQDAVGALKVYAALREKGLVSEEAFAAAERAVRDALVLYRDALADVVAALSAKEAAEQRHTSLAAQAVAVEIQAAKAAEAAAKARGNETAAVRESVHIKELEAKQASVVADGKAREAAAAQATAKAKIEEINASTMTAEKKKEEIAAVEDAVKAKALEADAARETAKTAEAEADAASRAARAKKEVAEASDEAATAVARAGQVAADTGYNYGELAKRMGVAKDSLDAFTRKFDELMQKSAGASGANAIGGAFMHAIKGAADYAKELAYVQDLTERLQAASQEGSRDLLGLVQVAERAAAANDALGDEDLAGLRSALAAAKSQMESLRDSAESTLASLEEELANLNGQYAEAERLRTEARRAQLQAQMAQAQAQGNVAAAEALARALSVLDQVASRKIEAAREREREERAQAAAPASTTTSTGSASRTPSAQSAAAARVAEAGVVTQTVHHTTNLNIGGILDVSDRVTVEGLARKLAPVLGEIKRREGGGEVRSRGG